MLLNMCRSVVLFFWLSHWSTSDGMLSGPGALLLFILAIAVSNSLEVNGDMSMMVSVCIGAVLPVYAV